MSQNEAATFHLNNILAGAFNSACMAELKALKPGNVHIFADGHGMRVQDFMRSAQSAATQIALPGLSVGERIQRAVEASWLAVGCNTNLGIVLLCAPLIQAMLLESGGSPRERLRNVLAGLTLADAEFAFQAILRASPAGLGISPRHDVQQSPTVTLLEAMREAQGRDRIAWQYTSVFEDVFEFGVPRYHECRQRWNSEEWATSAVYLGFLARFDDTHVVRKFGAKAGIDLRAEAAIHEAALLACENPITLQQELLEFDRVLKARGINPGTSADLTVASLMVVTMREQYNNGGVFEHARLVNNNADK